MTTKTKTKKKVGKKKTTKKAKPAAKKKVGKKKTTKRPVKKKAAVKKSTTKKKTAKKASAKKKTTKKKTTRKSAPSSLPTGSPFSNELHGVELSVGDLKKSRKSGVVAMLDLSSIQPVADFNPRANLGDVKELASSIKSEGLLQPLLVRPGKKVGQWDLISGARRHKAMVSIGYAEAVPCLIRLDLVGDDDRALAVAIAENSEDGRTSLTWIEIGRAVNKLGKRGWAVAKIARESGLHVQRVRRAKLIMETPEAVQENVAAGRWSVQAGLEYAKLDPATRNQISASLKEAMTAEDIKRVRKEAQKDATAKAAAQGKSATTKDGKAVGARPALALWRGSRTKQEMLQHLCHIVHTMKADEMGTPDNHAFRGAIAWALWDRGDRDTPAPPDLSPDKSSPDYEVEQKDAVAFQATIKAEAAKYKPKEE